MLAGFSSSMTDGITDERQILMKHGPKLNEILSERTNIRLMMEKQKGLDYLENYLVDNKTAIKTQSGIVYHETTAGTGAQALENSFVEVHYHGMLIDGTVFDSSVDRGESLQIPLDNVIKGWREGVALMKEGKSKEIDTF